MLTLRVILKLIPWIIALVLACMLWMNLYTSGVFNSSSEQTTVIQNSVLQKIESLGKLELVRYNFRDITELQKKGRQDYFNIINWGEDAKMVLVSSGSAIGCIDLTRIKDEHIQVRNDTLYVQLPEPELCNHKLDMESTYIYALETGRRINRQEFIQEGYRMAEQKVKDAALESGILDQTAVNAELVLRPLLESVGEKPVIFVKNPPKIRLTEPL